MLSIECMKGLIARSNDSKGGAQSRTNPVGLCARATCEQCIYQELSVDLDIWVLGLVNLVFVN